jgi:gliding motility-associated-like protein
MKHKIILIFLLNSIFLYSQPGIEKLNLSSFTPVVKISSTDIPKLVSKPFLTHPDLGVKTFRHPDCDNCIELIQHRDANSRLYVEENTNGSHFYQQKSYTPVNYKDEKEWWREIDYRLKPEGKEIFTARSQPSPVEINTGAGTYSIRNNEYVITLSEPEIILTDDHHTESVFSQPDWQNLTAGDDGIRIKNIYPDVDFVIIVGEGQAEAGFVINKPLKRKSGNITFRQKMTLNKKDLKYTLSENELNISTSNNTSLFNISKSFAYDPNGKILPMKTEADQNYISVSLSLEQMEKAEMQYPVFLDPLVTSQNSLAAGSIAGTKFGAVCWTNSCDYFLSVPSPPNATITNITQSFEYSTAGICTAQDGGYNIDFAGCTAPSGAVPVYTCPFNIAPFSCNYSNVSVPEFVSCFPPPQCAAGNLDFTLHFFRCNNDPDPTCAANCIRASQPWIMIIEGHTLELNFVTPSHQICTGQADTLVVVPEFGVPPYTYNWSPGGANTDSLAISPSTTTSYTVTVTDACGSTQTATTTVTLTSNTNPGFTIIPDTACAGDAISITANGAALATSYDWTLPGSDATGGAIDDAQNVTVQYPLQGTFPVTLHYTDGSCVFDSTLDVVITSQAVVDVSLNANPPTAICQNDTVVFTAVPVNGGTTPVYDWLVDNVLVQSGPADSLVTGQLSNGSLVQVIIHSNSTCVSLADDTASLFVAVTNPVATDVTVSPDTAVCPGSPVTFSASPVNGGAAPSYQWSVNGSNIPGATSASFNLNVSSSDTIVTVEMTSSLGCVIAQTVFDSSSVGLLSNVNAAVVLIANPNTQLCSGDTVTFTAQSQNGGNNPSFQFYINGIPSGASTSDSVFTYVPADGDSVSVQLVSNLPCVLTAIANDDELVSVSTSLIPIVNVTSFPPYACPGQQIVFTAHHTGGGSTPGFEWYVNNNAIFTGDSIFIFTVDSLSQNVKVILISSSPCSIVPSDTASMSLTILQPPVADFTYTDPAPGTFIYNLHFTDLSTDAVNYTWIFHDTNDTLYVREPDHLYSAAGTYEVTLAVQSNNGCTDTITYTIQIAEFISVFYPNAFTPNNDDINEFFAPIGASLGEYEMTIFNRWGQKIFTGDENTPWTGMTGTVPVPQGVYIYRIDLKAEKFEKRIVTGRVSVIY